MKVEAAAVMPPTARVGVVGDSGVGKSALVTRFAGDKFRSDLAATVGVDCAMRTMEVRESDGGAASSVKLQVWDTAGAERFGAITRAYLRNARVAVVVFSLEAPARTAPSVAKWVEEVREHSPQAQVVVVGSQSDRADQDVADANAAGFWLRPDVFFPSADLPNYHCVSAKTNDGVERLFRHVAQLCVRPGPPGEAAAQGGGDVHPFQYVQLPPKVERPKRDAVGCRCS